MNQVENEVKELKVKLQETQQQLRAEREAEKLGREQVQGEDAALLGKNEGRKSDEMQDLFKAQVKKVLKNIVW